MAWFGASLLFGQANDSGNAQLGNGTLRSEGRLASTGINLVYGAGPSRLIACLLLGATLTVTGGATDLGAATTRSGGRLAGQLTTKVAVAGQTIDQSRVMGTLTTRVAMAGVVRTQSRTFSTGLGTNLSLGTGTIQSSARLTGLGSSRVALAGTTEATGRLVGSLEMAGTTVALAGAIQGQSALASSGINLVYPAGPVRVQTLLAGTLGTTSGATPIGTGTTEAVGLLRGLLASRVALGGQVEEQPRLIGTLGFVTPATPLGTGTILGTERLRSTGINLVYPAAPIRFTGARVRATGILDVPIPIQGGVLRSGGVLWGTLGVAAEHTLIGQGKFQSGGRLLSTGITLVYPAAPIRLTGALTTARLTDFVAPVALAGTTMGGSGLLYGLETTITEFAAEIVGPTTILRGQLGFVPSTVGMGAGQVRSTARLTGSALQSLVPLQGTIGATATLPAATLGVASGATLLGNGQTLDLGRLRGVLSTRIPMGGGVVLDGARLRGSLGSAAEFPSLAGTIAASSGRLWGQVNVDLELSGVGVGRTHLWLGQVANEAVPASAAANLYVLTGAYGQGAGLDTLALTETPDIAPLGVQGRIRLRRIVVPIRHAGACTVRITPIVDYNTALDSLSVSYEAPATPRRRAIQKKVLRGCTVVRLRIEVTTTTGAVEVYTPTLYYDPITQATSLAMGGAP